MADPARPTLATLILALTLSACAAPKPGGRQLAAQEPDIGPAVGAAAPAPTSQATAETAVRRFFAVSFADDKAIDYRFAPYVRSSVSQAGIREHGIFLCGTLKPRASTNDDPGQQMFFAHFNPLKRDVVDNASVQPGQDTLTAAMCRQAYANAGVRLPG